MLHAAGYTLATASGEASLKLDGYLIGMRVGGCFVAFYGPDQVDTEGRPPLMRSNGIVLTGSRSSCSAGWSS